MTPPLDLLDIHEPAPVSWWPPAPGWWALLALSLLLLGLGWWWRRRRLQRRLPRLALREAEQLYAEWQRSGDTAAYSAALNALLKRTALACHAEPGVARLSGRAWLDFLDRGLRQPRFATPALAGFADPYARQPTVDPHALQQAAHSWLRRQRC